jgi:mRNA interferase MazF
MELSVIKIGWIVMDQIQAIDKLRIVSTLGRLSNPELKEVKSVMKETFIE